MWDDGKLVGTRLHTRVGTKNLIYILLHSASDGFLIDAARVISAKLIMSFRLKYQPANFFFYDRDPSRRKELQ